MKKVLFLIVFLAGILALFSSIFAAPAMPRYGINEETKECSKFFMGDECMLCSAPENWEFIEEMECPDGYNQVDKEPFCQLLKNEFCCTVSHSGMSGDCDDVVVNHVSKKCAFVENIGDCEELPEDWERAKKNEIWGTVCPNWDYEWLEGTLMCKMEISERDAGGQQISQEQKQFQQIQQKSTERITILLASAIVLLLSVGLIFVLH